MRPVEAKEEALKKGGQTKNKGARVGKARKPPPPPSTARQGHKGPSGTSGPHGKSKIKGRRNSSADAKAYRKTKAGSQS